MIDILLPAGLAICQMLAPAGALCRTSEVITFSLMNAPAGHRYSFDKVVFCADDAEGCADDPWKGDECLAFSRVYGAVPLRPTEAPPTWSTLFLCRPLKKGPQS